MPKVDNVFSFIIAVVVIIVVVIAAVIVVIVVIVVVVVVVAEATADGWNVPKNKIAVLAPTTIFEVGTFSAFFEFSTNCDDKSTTTMSTFEPHLTSPRINVCRHSESIKFYSAVVFDSA